MQITVDLPDELAVRAKAAGKAPEDFVADLMRMALDQPDAPRQRLAGKISWTEFRERISKYPASGATLPAAALTREGIYQDHD